MENIRKPIETELGIISGRDAIDFDKQEMIQKPFGLVFTGEINGDLCSKNNSNRDWIPYQLCFDYPIIFSCCELDLYKETDLVSSFDILENSKLIANIHQKDYGRKFKDEFKHYIFATYDYVFEIVARDFTFVVLEKQTNITR